MAMSDGMASMTRWMVVDYCGDRRLFGFADRHPVTGGLAWTLSTPIVVLDEPGLRATTASGRRYELGTRVSIEELDEEGRLARELLVLGRHPAEFSRCDISWLVACKWARHLEVAPPPRTDCEAVGRFIQSHASRYQALRSAR